MQRAEGVAGLDDSVEERNQRQGKKRYVLS